MNINTKTLKSTFLHRALVLVNAYKCAVFQLSSSISYRDMEGSKNWGCWSPQTPPSEQIITRSHSTCKWLPAYQISTF